MREQQGSLQRGDQIARLRGSLLAVSQSAELTLSKAQVDAQQPRPRLGQRRASAELLQLLTQAAVRATELDDRAGLVERRTHQRAQPVARICVPGFPAPEEVLECLDVGLDHRLRQLLLGAEVVIDV